MKLQTDTGRIMNTRQMKYFIRVFELGNMTKAAATLHVAQPALTQQIHLLEEELGIALFIRSTRGVKPTGEGTLLYKHARTILRQIDNTKAILHRKDNAISGTVSIALASSTARMLALPLIREVKQRYPSVILEIVDLPSADLTRQVLQGRVDFALTPDQQEIKGVTLKPFLVEELLLLLRADMPMKKRRVTIEDIRKLPLILPSLPNRLRSRIDHAFLERRLPYELIAEASTSAILIPAVRHGLAATILPYSAAHDEIHEGTISMRRFDFEFIREIFICHADNATGNEAVTCVIAACEETASRLIAENIWKYTKLL